MKKTKDEAELTRKAVLNAAMKVFSKNGYTQTSLTEVAKEAGLTRGAIYWHFNNKHQLLSAVIDECDKDMELMINGILNSATSPVEKIRALISTIISTIVMEEQFRVIEDILVFKTSTNSELQKIYQRHMDNIKKFRKMMIDLISEGIAAGVFDPRFSPETVAVAMTSYIAGIKTVWLSDIIMVSEENFSIKEKAGELADLIIHGFAKS